MNIDFGTVEYKFMIRINICHNLQTRSEHKHLVKSRGINLYVYSFDKLTNKNIKTEKRVLHDSMTSIDEKENRGPEGYINLM